MKFRLASLWLCLPLAASASPQLYQCRLESVPPGSGYRPVHFLIAEGQTLHGIEAACLLPKHGTATSFTVDIEMRRGELHGNFSGEHARFQPAGLQADFANDEAAGRATCAPYQGSYSLTNSEGVRFNLEQDDPYWVSHLSWSEKTRPVCFGGEASVAAASLRGAALQNLSPYHAGDAFAACLNAEPGKIADCLDGDAKIRNEDEVNRVETYFASGSQVFHVEASRGCALPQSTYPGEWHCDEWKAWTQGTTELPRCP